MLHNKINVDDEKGKGNSSSAGIGNSNARNRYVYVKAIIVAFLQEPGNRPKDPKVKASDWGSLRTIYGFMVSWAQKRPLLSWIKAKALHMDQIDL